MFDIETRLGINRQILNMIRREHGQEALASVGARQAVLILQIGLDSVQFTLMVDLLLHLLSLLRDLFQHLIQLIIQFALII